jgi:hypothetical protein
MLDEHGIQVPDEVGNAAQRNSFSVQELAALGGNDALVAFLQAWAATGSLEKEAYRLGL